MKISQPEVLIEFGIHFGHKTHRLHPSFKKYLYKNENGISIIDLFKTAPLLDRACEFVHSLGKEGKTILFVGTKKQARSILVDLCKEKKLNYVSAKWVGGFITNYEEISKNVKKLTEMKREKEEGTWDKLPKHEKVKNLKKLARIATMYDGVEGLTNVPEAIFIIDIKRELNAVLEAKAIGIPIIAITDSNTDPNLADYPIPANDDAISSIQHITEQIVNAYLSGQSSKPAHD